MAVIAFRNLLYLKTYPGDVRDLYLDFSATNNRLGEIEVNFKFLSECSVVTYFISIKCCRS